MQFRLCCRECRKVYCWRAWSNIAEPDICTFTELNGTTNTVLQSLSGSHQMVLATTNIFSFHVAADKWRSSGSVKSILRSVLTFLRYSKFIFNFPDVYVASYWNITLQRNVLPKLLPPKFKCCKHSGKVSHKVIIAGWCLCFFKL